MSLVVIPKREFGLLTNDALLLAVADRLKIYSVASADKIFSSAPNFRLFSPDDLK